LERLGTESEPALITEDALKHKWREVSDDTEIRLSELRVRLPRTRTSSSYSSRLD
jgi:hypothetical protein